MERLPDATLEPTRDDVVLFAEAEELFPELRARLRQTQRRIQVPPPLKKGSDLNNKLLRPGERWDQYEERRDRTIAARLKRLRRLMHKQEGDDVSTALCLSGGGIRSATFSLGIVQGLAIKKVLPDFHYLSTVSGGGYLGSLLSAWIRNKALALEVEAQEKSLAEVTRSGESQQDPTPIRADFHSAARKHVIACLGSVGDGQSEEPKPVRRLRAFSNYLSPMRGVSADFLTLLAIYARNLILNWLILFPTIFACLMFPRFYLAVLQMPAPEEYTRKVIALIAWALVGWTVAYMASDLPAPPSGRSKDPGERLTNPPPPKPDRVFLQLVLPLIVAGLLVSCLVGWEAVALTPKQLWKEWTPSFIVEPLGRLGLPDAWQATVLFMVLGALTQGVSSVLGGFLLREVRDRESGKRPADWAALVAVSVAGGLTGAAIYWLVVFLLEFAVVKVPDRHLIDLRALALWSTPLVMATFWLGVTLYAGWRRPVGSEDEREWWARAAARWMLPSVAWLALCALVFYLPGALLTSSAVQSFFISESGAAAAGVGAGALGLLVAIGGFLMNKGPAWRQKAESFAAEAGMRVFDLVAIAFLVVFLALMSLVVTGTMRLNDTLKNRQEEFVKKHEARLLLKKSADVGPKEVKCGGVENPCASLPERIDQRYTGSLLDMQEPGVILAAILGCIALALATSYRIGVNTFSLHSLYGNRLVRAYLAASRRDSDRRPHWFTGFDPKDNLPVHETWPERTEVTAPDPRPRLMHIINIALNMVKASESRLEWQHRKATAFTVTPLFSGSAITGYIQSSKYLKTAHINGISLGCAMTMSGAAASPNMGYHSSLPLAIVMTLFNVRLGMWLPNPRWVSKSGWPQKRDEPVVGFQSLMNEALGDTSAETPYLYLSDGGHFDNTGIYEMVRRRVRHIVLVDAGADPDYQFDDILSTVRKIRIDMGITIEFTTELPGPKDKRRSGVAVGIAKIRYSHADANAKDGTLVLFKPALVPDDPAGPWLPNDVRRYAAESARDKDAFPQQPTSDQFFDEAQFESYRMLGLHAVLSTYGPVRTANANDESAPMLSPGFLGLAQAAGLMAAPPIPPAPVGGSAPPPPAAPPPAASDSEGTSGLFAAIRENAGILAATAVVSAATATGVAGVNAPSKTPDPRLIASVGKSPPLVEPARGPSEDELKPPPLKASEPASSSTGQSPPVLSRDEAKELIDLARSSAAAAANASSSANRANESVKAAIANADRTAVTTQRAVDAAASAADAAAKSALAAAAIQSMSRDIAEIRRSIGQVPPRSNVRSGEGSR